MRFDAVPGGVTAAGGYLAAGAAGGLKGEGLADVAVVYSQVAAQAAGLFTTNRVQAAPVLLSKRHLAGGRARAVVANSGCANACTGSQGWHDAVEMVRFTADLLGTRPEEVLVASTGVIGVPLPLPAVKRGISLAAAALAADGGTMAARAIMTTDTRPKEAARSFEMNGRRVTVGGMAKGSGMIHPNLATMLAFITTDLAVDAPLLATALRQAVGVSFNMVSVDGDTSTNDMVLLLANGSAGTKALTSPADPGWLDFCAALTQVCQELAQDIARDGEGANKLLEVEVRGAASEADARSAAKAVVGSNLVKTAVFGADANWGRILAAVGYSGADFDPEQVAIYLEGDGLTEQVVAGGTGLPFDEQRAAACLAAPTVRLVIDLSGGSHAARAWGCDLSYDYVKINAAYRT